MVLGAGVLRCVGGRKVGGDLCDPLRMGSERKGRTQQVFCYKGGDESGEMRSGEQERCGSTIISPLIVKS